MVSEQEEDEEDDKAEIRAAAEHISSIFWEPLEAKNACLVSLNDKVDEIVDFCRKYLDVLEDYKKVWYKLHTTHDARNWPNVLLLSQLLFSLPFTNSIIKRAFCAMKVVKTDRCTNLLTSTLDDLMEINVEGPTQKTSPLMMLYSSGRQTEWEDLIREPETSIIQDPLTMQSRRVVTLSQKSLHLMTGTDCLLIENSQPHGYI